MCPYIDKADTRCSDHLTFRNVGHAFEYCAGKYCSCPVFRYLSANDPRYDHHQSDARRLAAS